MCDTCPEPGLDRLPRAQLRDAGLGDMPADLADVLDEWLHRNHGVLSSSHNVGDFLDSLADAGYRVERIDPGLPIEQLLSPSTD